MARQVTVAELGSLGYNENIMRIIVCLFALLFIATAQGQGATLIRVDRPRIERLATREITAKYPKIKVSDLVFNEIKYSISAEGDEAITVTYKLPATIETKDESDQKSSKVTTKVETVVVTLSISGEVKNVSKGSSFSQSVKSAK
jgi:hypothetical protein